MKIGIQTRVKFRAFGVTFGTVDKTLVVEIKPSGLVTVVKQDVPVPPNAHKVFDSRGVLLKVWQFDGQ